MQIFFISLPEDTLKQRGVLAWSPVYFLGVVLLFLLRKQQKVIFNYFSLVKDDEPFYFFMNSEATESRLFLGGKWAIYGRSFTVFMKKTNSFC